MSSAYKEFPHKHMEKRNNNVDNDSRQINNAYHVRDQ